MNYIFQKRLIENVKTDFFDIQSSNENYSILENFSDSDWTSAKVQTIIDGVQHAKDTGEEYDWGNEDVTFSAEGDEVWFTDLLGYRAGKEADDEVFSSMTTEEFLTFLKDFKAFLEKNGV